MKFQFSVILLLLSYSGIAQQIFKSKDASLSAITSSGKSYHYFNDDENIVVYDRSDQFGKFKVMHYFLNGVTQRVALICTDPAENGDRQHSFYINVTSRSDIKYDFTNLDKFTLRNTAYYQSWASYELHNNYDRKLFYIEIYILD
jgi:hypothetical protein